MNCALGIKKAGHGVQPTGWQLPSSRLDSSRRAVAFLTTFIILNSLFLIPAHAQCVASCPEGQAPAGSCQIDLACVPSIETCSRGFTCAAASTPAEGGSTAPSTPLTLPNPLGTANVPIIVGRIIKAISGFAGTIGLLMFVYGGFQWLTSGGNAEKIKKGKDIILWSLIGLVVMFSSYIATKYIIETLVTTTVR